MQIFCKEVTPEDCAAADQVPVEGLTYRTGTLADFDFMFSNMLKVYEAEEMIHRSDGEFTDEKDHARRTLASGGAVIAELDGKPVGMITGEYGTIWPYGYGFPDHDPPGYRWISYSFALPEYRGKNIGKWLYRLAEKLAHEDGYEKLYLNTYFNNALGVKVHKALGFHEDVTIWSKKL